MADFEFNREEILGVLYDAEVLIVGYPSVALQNIRRCLELACRYHLGLDSSDRTPLLDLLRTAEVKDALGADLEVAHLLREAGNEALHGQERFGVDHAKQAALAIRKLLGLLGLKPETLNESDPGIRIELAAEIPPSQPVNRITPDWQTINSWPGQQGLTNGERFLVELFDRDLGNDWQIFVQPYFLGLRPDIVLLNPRQQVIHIEVKDWELDGHYWNSEGKLRDGRFTGRDQIRENPILQANLVRNRFLDGPLADLNEKRLANKVLKSVLYFHCGARAQAKHLFEKSAEDSGIKLLHREDIEHDGVTCFSSSSNRKFGGPGSEGVLESLRSYLGMPEYVTDRLVAQPAQRRLCLTKWDQPDSQGDLFGPDSKAVEAAQSFERVRGGAGSGKSHIVALRAAKASRRGKRVLITSYHITMSNYLYGLVRRSTTDPSERERILVRHFHGFLYDQQVTAGTASGGKESSSPSLATVLEGLFANSETVSGYSPPVFDAIYIDEGQDMEADQIAALRRFLAIDGELVLFSDGRQDVHGKFRLWRRLPVPFKGWRQLNGSSQRLPDFVAKWLNFVAAESRVGDESDAPLMPTGSVLPGMNDLHNPMWWANVDSELEGVEAVPFAIELIKCQFPTVHPADIVVLTHRRNIGLPICGRMVRAFGQNTVKHVFGDSSERDRIGNDDHIVRRQKVAFHQADGRFKASTIHSFKGWESQFVILVWTPFNAQSEAETAKMAALFYTGASRCRKGMVIINCDPEFARFRNEAWTDFWSAAGNEMEANWRGRVANAKPLLNQRTSNPFDEDAEESH